MNPTQLTRVALLLIGAASLPFLQGCASTAATSPVMGTCFKANLSRSDYEVLQTVEGRGEVTKILFFAFGDKQFGSVVPTSADAGPIGPEARKAMAYTVVGIATAGIGIPFVYAYYDAKQKNANAAAIFDAKKKVPGADYVIPVSGKSSSTGFPFIYSHTISDVRCKAIRIKSDSQLGM